MSQARVSGAALDGVAVGDVVVLAGERGARRVRVKSVGRKWVTAGGQKFAIATGEQAPPVYGVGTRLYTVAQWKRREAKAALREAIRRVADYRSFEHLSDDEIRTIATELTAIGLRVSPCLAAFVASPALPIREPVHGAPRQPGDRVRVVAVVDSTTDPEHVGKVGRVEYLEYSCGSGQSYPGDPLIGVDLDGGGREEFWREELADESAGAAPLPI